MIANPVPREIPTTAERLRYYRFQCAMLQQDVAKAVGINARVYSAYEDVLHDYYPPDRMDKLAALFRIDVYELLDEYNHFLYDGQGMSLKAIRKERKLTQFDFGRLLSVPTSTVKRWEQEKIRLSKDMWERISNL